MGRKPPILTYPSAGKTGTDSGSLRRGNDASGTESSRLSIGFRVTLGNTTSSGGIFLEIRLLCSGNSGAIIKRIIREDKEGFTDGRINTDDAAVCKDEGRVP